MQKSEPKVGFVVTRAAGEEIGEITGVFNQPGEEVKALVRWVDSGVEEWLLPVALRFVELNDDQPLQEVLWALVKRTGVSKIHVRHEGSVHTICNRLIQSSPQFAPLKDGVECQYCDRILKKRAEAEVQKQAGDLRLEKAWSFCTNNRNLVERSTRCGCFNCLVEFEPNDVYNWVDEGGVTATCPYCFIDAVLPNAASIPVGIDVLREMKEKFVDDAAPPARNSPLAALQEKKRDWKNSLH
tara:strand:- start:1165 stop:1887 length:723 start_codon:yes stop_codon:yes gene_type:complete